MFAFLIRPVGTQFLASSRGSVRGVGGGFGRDAGVGVGGVRVGGAGGSRVAGLPGEPELAPLASAGFDGGGTVGTGVALRPGARPLGGVGCTVGTGTSASLAQIGSARADKSTP